MSSGSSGWSKPGRSCTWSSTRSASSERASHCAVSMALTDAPSKSTGTRILSRCSSMTSPCPSRLQPPFRTAFAALRGPGPANVAPRPRILRRGAGGPQRGAATIAESIRPLRAPSRRNEWKRVGSQPCSRARRRRASGAIPAASSCACTIARRSTRALRGPAAGRPWRAPGATRARTPAASCRRAPRPRRRPPRSSTPRCAARSPRRARPSPPTSSRSAATPAPRDVGRPSRAIRCGWRRRPRSRDRRPASARSRRCARRTRRPARATA